MRFTVLASGSSGNASFVEAGGFGVLLDFGLGPRLLGYRLKAIGASWRDVQAVLLTHTHSDHWRPRTLAHLRRQMVPLYCHAEHQVNLRGNRDGLAPLLSAGLVHFYQAGQDIILAPGLRCRPLPLSHDGGPTFGFRFEGVADLFGQTAAFAYAADVGSWSPELAQALADVDLLALEFNHDVELEQASGRSAGLVDRILGDAGHLSNHQAASLVQEVVRRSSPGRLLQLVQLHLSRPCNRPALARAAVRALAIEVHAASQDRPTRTFAVGARPRGKRPLTPLLHAGPGALSPQQCLPGLEG